ncbi:hypothetical protein [Alkalihalobacterium alkalinitrilicum]|uniref:hypothetical protein n=1 Tax=Alkalihalobacterium alkalinitrilicum TaxID=427920 RepID=UPI0009952C88|nr:hypothetical protein [Alkalihalobacterium alkalinitrilicum]
MDKNSEKSYNSDIINNLGVINLSNMVTPSKFLKPTEDKKLVTRKPQNARDLRKMIGTRSATGQKLVDIYKQGR